MSSTASDLDAEVRRIWAEANVFPLWENRAAHAKPKGAEPAHHWSWPTLEPMIRQATQVRSMEAVERRVLMLVSPHSQPVGGAAGTVTNLNANLQILLPGEKARPHRHSMNALRFVMSGNGAVTVVDGKACEMNEFDLVTTPGWCWHEHQHRGDAPIVWLDVLDASLHRYLGTDLFQPGPANDVPVRISDSAFSTGTMLPQTGEALGNFSPIFRYPWAQASNAVGAAPRARDGARRVRYANPETGGPVMSFLDCYLVQVDAGTRTLPFRTSANAVCTVVEGHGHSKIGERDIVWGPRDVFNIPHGNWSSHHAERDTVRLFVVTDRDVFRRLDLLTEDYDGQA
ncbi:MAG: cupin protein [Frankiales bacterium]|nr:cupin protein [Frankiales bacterium]